MAVSKLWLINEGGLSRVLQYAANPKKTNNKLYVNGINCEPETAYEEVYRGQALLCQNRRH